MDGQMIYKQTFSIQKALYIFPPKCLSEYLGLLIQKLVQDLRLKHPVLSVILYVMETPGKGCELFELRGNDCRTLGCSETPGHRTLSG